MPLRHRRILSSLAFFAAVSSASLAEGADACDRTGSLPPHCGDLETFESNALAGFSPNLSDHVLFDLIDVTSLEKKGAVEPRYALGFGPSFHWAPFATQIFRVGAGVDFLFGDWGGDRLGDFTVEPHGRATLELHDFGVAGIDVYADVGAPFFSPSHTWAAGLGGGVTGRLINRVYLDVGYARTFGPSKFNASDAPDAQNDSVRVALGYDLLTFVMRGRPAKTQTEVDLRCEILAAAAAAKNQVQCADVLTALATVTQAAKPEPDRTRAFLEALPANVAATLLRIDQQARDCVTDQQRLQRTCLDCSSKSFLFWKSYQIDPAQVASALGCLGTADSILCDPGSREVEMQHGAACFAKQ